MNDQVGRHRCVSTGLVTKECILEAGMGGAIAEQRCKTQQVNLPHRDSTH
ncbi:MAG: hypothetical protein ACAF41_16625 [Leptolyngbya sp. BL-A-14]